MRLFAISLVAVLLITSVAVKSKGKKAPSPVANRTPSKDASRKACDKCNTIYDIIKKYKHTKDKSNFKKEINNRVHDLCQGNKDMQFPCRLLKNEMALVMVKNLQKDKTNIPNKCIKLAFCKQSKLKKIRSAGNSLSELLPTVGVCLYMMV